MRTAALWALMMTASVATAAAQDIGGYITAGSGSIDYLVHRETIPQASVGVLWRVAGDRVRLGGELDVMTSNGYFAGRGGPFAEVVLFRHQRATPFVRAGRFVGEDTSWIAGGGVDVWLTDRAGLRLTVQDAFRQSKFTSGHANSSYTFHEPSFQVGWVWR